MGNDKPRVLNASKDKLTPDNLPPNAVYVGRAAGKFPASKWGNPFVIGRDGTRDEVIAKYRAWIVQQPELMAALPELRGKDLVCWWTPRRCHAEVLIELANK